MELPIQVVRHSHGENKGRSIHNSSGCSTTDSASVKRPETMLVHFALCLRIIQVTTSGLRQLAFAWATVILLGGFVSNLKPIDFWFVTAILVVEGTRLSTGGFELKLKSKSTLPANTFHRRIQSDSSILSLLGFFLRADFIYSSCILPYQMRKLDEGTTLSQPKRTGLPAADDPLLSYSGRVIVKNTCGLLYCLQFFLASSCVALSVTRLVQQDYEDEAQINLKSAINVFYSVALGEALMIFLEMGYWIWRINVQELFQRVAKEYGFGPMGMGFLCHFFDDGYSKCIEGRIFDVLNMNLFSFAEELLDSDSRKEQSIGATILRLSVQEITRLTDDTLNKIGNSKLVLKRLLEMLNWEDPKEKNIRCLASEIVCMLASDEQLVLLVVAIPKAMESIASLLYSGGGIMDGRSYEASQMEVEAYDFSTFNQLGLLILKHLARSHDNCLKIMNASDLLSRIVILTSTPKVQLHELVPESPRIMTMCLALQVVKTLAVATEWTGKILLTDIFDNIKELLKYGESHLKLRMLGLEILVSWGKHFEARKNIKDILDIRNIDNTLTIIFQVFFHPIEKEMVGEVCNKAREVLMMLIHESSKKLVDAFGNPTLDPMLRVEAGSLLVYVCDFCASCEFDRVIVAVMQVVLKTIMEEKEKEMLLEMSIELAMRILKSNNLQVFENEIKIAGITDEVFFQNLLEILRRYNNPKSKVPKMMKSVIQYANCLMFREQKYIELFRDLEIDQDLMQTARKADEFEVDISTSIMIAMSLEKHKRERV